MRNTLLTLTVGSISLFGMMSANAANAPQTFNSDGSGIYILGQLGYIDSKIGSSFNGEVSLKSSLNLSGPAQRVAIGYKFNKNIGIETGYTNLKKSSIRDDNFEKGVTVTAEGSSIDLVGVGTIPINDSISVYGKAGAAYLKTEYTESVDGKEINANGPNASGIDKNVLAPEVGVGINYNINNNLYMDTSYTHIEVIGRDKTGNKDFLAVGLGYRFG